MRNYSLKPDCLPNQRAIWINAIGASARCFLGENLPGHPTGAAKRFPRIRGDTVHILLPEVGWTEGWKEKPKMHKCLKRNGFLEKYGAAEGTRTPDPIITNDVLYQLSYSGLRVQGPSGLRTDPG